MKKLLLVSDSHGMNGIFKYVYDKHKDDIDYFICLGDVEDKSAVIEYRDYFYFIRGNNDFYYIPCDEKQELMDNEIQLVRSEDAISTYFMRFKIEDIVFEATHGDQIYLTVEDYMYYQEDIDCLLFGHTHQFEVVREDNRIVGINPGCCNILGARGDRIASYCIVTIDGKEILDVERIVVDEYLGYEELYYV